MKEFLDPNFWTPDMIFTVVDAVVFFFFAIAVLYLLVFAVKSIGKTNNLYEVTKKKYKFAVVFPAYMEDRVILTSVESFFEQSYPRDKYDVIVVSDRMKDETNTALEQLGAIVIKHDFDNSNKTKALQEAVKYIDAYALNYDYIVILDADNWVDEYFLSKMNDAFYSGCTAIQSHRVAKNYNTNIAILDSVSEEINNSIFRKGHVKMGFSSSLIGSGMAFEYPLFRTYIMKAGNIGVDKQLEKFLLKNRYYIEYLPDIYTYDEKVSKKGQFYRQRGRWLSNQFSNLLSGIFSLPMAAFEGNWDYCNKLFQWMMPPRLILLGVITIIAILFSIFGSILAFKWWALLVVLLIVLAIAIPDYLCNKQLMKALASLPILFVLMLINMFNVFRRNKPSNHTEHYEV